MHRVLEDGYRRTLRRDGGGPRGGRLARVGQLGEAGADLLELGEVRGIGDDQRPNGPVLGRASPRLDAYAVARGGHQGVEIVLHHCVHGVLVAGGVAGDRLGTGHDRAIGAAGVEVERLLGGEGGHQAAPHEQDEQRAH